MDKITEKKWQESWNNQKDLYVTNDNSGKPKKYILVEFPYPSGSGLHVGHAFSYTGGDVHARYWRMKGYEVMFPMGWDAFGLPTENYAIKTKRKPQEITKENTDNYKNEMNKLAFSFDWNREVNTTDPKYYKWTQWIFIKLFEQGLAYKKEMPINWCPSCKVGLANEEVVDGKCERCGTGVERRTISQWVVKITEYADKLIDGLKETNFIEKVKQQQIKWIGKSEGARIRFQVKTPLEMGKGLELEVFTTRPDTIGGATFMVIAPEHNLVQTILSTSTSSVLEIQKYLEDAKKKSEMDRTDLAKEKTGVFSGLYAINPYTNAEIPIWISDFVLSSYGTGAIMSVPSLDERDKEFAVKYNLPIVELTIDDSESEKKRIIKWLAEKGIGETANSYHLRDWIFSRQHYWGEPIPMVNCPTDGWVAEKLENLPIILPELDAYEPTDDGKSPLSKVESFVKCRCPKCGGEAVRETDTMPNWAGSDWYYLRYCDVLNDAEICSKEKALKWLPVDTYIGGDEHNTLHLLYSRFIFRFLYDLGVVPMPEPYYRRISHGVILGPDNQRMSKSKGNVIVPEVVAEKYGVDVIRMYLMFMGPFDATMAWNEKTLMGVKRFLNRFEKFIGEQMANNSASSDEVLSIINKTIDGVEHDLENFKYNTAIAKMMESLNSLDGKSVGKKELTSMVTILAPLAPYTSEELWSSFGYTDSIHRQSWPVVSQQYLKEEQVVLPVAVNGKVKDQIIESSDVVAKAKQLIKIAELLSGKELIKEIYIPGKMINFVIK